MVDKSAFFVGLPDRILNHHLGSLSRAEEDAFLSPLSRRIFYLFFSIEFLPRDFRIFRAFRLPIRQANAKRGLASPFCVGLPDRIRTCDLKSRSLARYPAEPRADDLHPLLYTDFPAVSIQNRVYFLRPQKRRNVTRQALRTPRVCREVSKAAYAEAPPERPAARKPLPT